MSGAAEKRAVERGCAAPGTRWGARAESAEADLGVRSARNAAAPSRPEQAMETMLGEWRAARLRRVGTGEGALRTGLISGASIA